MFVMSRSGRPRSFDEREALSQARDLFWARGYAATSVQDLVDELSVQRGSLYGAFGDKRALYLRALALYVSDNRQRLETMLQADPVLPVLRQLLTEPTSPTSDSDRAPTRGCLVGNTTAELVPDDPEARALVAAAFDGFVDVVAAALTRAQQRGEITTTASPQAQAQALLVVFQGSTLIARVDSGDRRRIIAGIDTVLDGLRAP